MSLSATEALEQAKLLVEARQAEKTRLDKIHKYLRGKQDHPVVPSGSPKELKRLAEMARVNVMEIVVSSVAQALYVDGYRSGKSSDDAPAWKVWQANKMDARQIGVHRAALEYGVAYALVLPGEPSPVIRGYSPRRLTALYDVDDQDWPRLALISDPLKGGWRYRMYDETSVYEFKADESGEPVYVGTKDHEAGKTPVVRFINAVDLDDDKLGEVEPLFELQDQIDLTTFSLLVAQHYQAFRQRYIVGWVPQDEQEALKATAGRIWLFDDDPDKVKVGEFEQADLKGYLESREESLRQAATLSQTPVHELIGQLVNLSAEALVASEAGHNRKVTERQMSFGESWEQALALAGEFADAAEDADSAQVRWRDTESRALSATVDALGKLAAQLEVPPQMLWERIPGTTQQDIERWTAAWKEQQAEERALAEAQMAAQAQRPKPPMRPIAA